MALTGSQFNGTCYPDQGSAFTAYLASSGAVAQTPGTTSYLNRFEYVSGVWRLRQYSIASNGVITQRSDTAYPLPLFPACDPAGAYQDGLVIGWGIAAAIICATALMLVRRGIRGG